MYDYAKGKAMYIIVSLDKPEWYKNSERVSKNENTIDVEHVFTVKFTSFFSFGYIWIGRL